MYVERNNKARSCNHCCSGRAIIITFSECVFVALDNQQPMRTRYIVICGQYDFTLFFQIVSLMAQFKKKRSSNIKCVLISCTTFVGNTSHSKKN